MREELIRDCAPDEAPRQLAPGTVVRLRPRGAQDKALCHHVGRVRSSAPGGRLKVVLHGILWPPSAASQGRQLVDLPVCDVQPVPRPLPAARRPVTLGGASVAAEMVTRLMGERGWGLLDGIAEMIAEYLRYQRIDSAEVTVSGSSSTRGDFPLSEVLTANASTWWISAAGSMPGGVGGEWLEFSCPGVRRIAFVGIKIPPLPQGPLSVREFHLLRRRIDIAALDLADDDESAWVLASAGPMHTLDTACMQELALDPPMDTQKVRLVCTTTAAAEGLAFFGGVDCVGLFQVCFA